MDLLGIRDNTASKPSLISSIWSLQVQPQQDTTTVMDMQVGSQQSLPQIDIGVHRSDDELNESEALFRHNDTTLRPSKSLSGLFNFRFYFHTTKNIYS